MKNLIFTLTTIICLVITANAQTKLWGVTSSGGANNHGTIFTADGNGGNFHVVYAMPNGQGSAPQTALILDNNGKLCGTAGVGSCGAGGVCYSYNPVTNTNNYYHDLSCDTLHGSGAGPLIRASDGMFYGACGVGGTNSLGVIYRVDPTNYTYTDLHDFTDSISGYLPKGKLAQSSNGKLYGNAQKGGVGNYGMLFSYDPLSNTYDSLFSFDYTTGSNPQNGIIAATNGKLYGLTANGGANFFGVIYSYDISTNTYTDIHDFDGTNGGSNSGCLIQASNGLLYGMTRTGGAGNYGVIYSFDITTNTYTNLHDFTSTDGANPWGGLMQASNGLLYGTTPFGGTNGVGVAFSYDISTNTFTVLTNFVSATIGARPYDLIETPDITCSANFFLYPDTNVLHHYFIQNNAGGNGPLHYNWSWGDGNFDTIPYPSHAYADTGFYNICLTITDSTGCTSTFCDSSYHVLNPQMMMAYIDVINPFTVGINNKISSNNIIIFPNPATAQITIKNLPLNSQISITDILGNETLPLTTICNLLTNINISQWSRGVYLLNIRNEKESLVKKVVIE